MSGFSVEAYDRARHADGPAKVVEAVFREHGFTWEPEGYHLDVIRPEEGYPPPDAFFAVAVEGGRVVGTIGGSREGGLAELKRMYVLSGARGRGVGRALGERFLSWAREARCAKAVLWSDKRFTAAHRLYERLGFRVTGERICEPDPDKSAEWGLTLDL